MRNKVLVIVVGVKVLPKVCRTTEGVRDGIGYRDATHGKFIEVDLTENVDFSQ